MLRVSPTWVSPFQNLMSYLFVIQMTYRLMTPASVVGRVPPMAVTQSATLSILLV